MGADSLKMNFFYLGKAMRSESSFSALALFNISLSTIKSTVVDLKRVVVPLYSLPRRI